MTFSIIARCRDTGRFGGAIASSSPAVAARCLRARAGVGVAASQNVTDPSLGVRALDLLALGASAGQAVDVLVQAEAPRIAWRQLLVLGRDGPPARFSGDRTLGVVAEAAGADAVAAGNLLADDRVPARMLAAFETTGGDLAGRLMQALQAGQAAGGEAGPVHSAGLLMVDAVSWPVVDLRLDWVDQDPVARLAEAWTVFAPQVDGYTTRALNPAAAPSFGVPGDP